MDRRAPDLATIARPVRALLLAFGAMPWALTLARGLLPLGRFGSLLDRSFVLLCHRIPERTLVLTGVPMPVCSRCAGIFAGVALGALLTLPRLSFSRARALLVAASVAMVVDVVLQEAGAHAIWHTARLATGVAFGYAAALAMLAAVRSAPVGAAPRNEVA